MSMRFYLVLIAVAKSEFKVVAYSHSKSYKDRLQTIIAKNLQLVYAATSGLREMGCNVRVQLNCSLEHK